MLPQSDRVLEAPEKSQLPPAGVDVLMRHKISPSLQGNTVLPILFLGKETEGIFASWIWGLFKVWKAIAFK